MNKKLPGTMSVIIFFIINACSQINIKNDELSETPLLKDFRDFCLDTKTESESVDVALKQAGAELISSKTMVFFHNGLKKLWSHSISAHTIWVATGSFQPHDNIVTGSTICEVQDFEDNGASLVGAQNWLKASISGPISIYRFTLVNRVPHLISTPSVVGRQNSVTSKELFEITIAKYGSSTSLMLLRRK